MVENKEQWIKTEETNNVTLIKTPLSDFIENINTEQEKLKPTILEQESVEEKKYKKYLWWIIKFIGGVTNFRSHYSIINNLSLKDSIPFLLKYNYKKRREISIVFFCNCKICKFYNRL